MNTSDNFLSKHWILIVLAIITLLVLYKFSSTCESFQYYTPNQNTCGDINEYSYYAPSEVCKANYDTSNICNNNSQVKLNSQYFGDNSDIVDEEIQFDLDSCTVDKGHSRAYKAYDSNFTCSA